jgi:hypothetical protein
MPNSPSQVTMPSHRFTNSNVTSTHAEVDWIDSLLTLLAKVTGPCEADLRDDGEQLEDLG